MRLCRTCTYWRATDAWDRAKFNEDGHNPCQRPYAHQLAPDDGYLTVEWPHTYATAGCRGYRRAWLAMTWLGVCRAWHEIKEFCWRWKYRITHRKEDWW